MNRAVAGLLIDTQPARSQHRRERERDQQREQRRGNNRQPVLAKELANSATDEGDGRVHDDVGHGDGDGRHADLAATRECGLERALAQVQVSVDVLEDDDRVVDQNADHQRQGHQAHDVEAEAERVHDQERADQACRNRQQHDDRVAPRVQEQQHDPAHEQDRQQQVVLNSIQRRPGEDRGVVGDDHLRA